MNGDLRVVGDVPRAFADLVVKLAPTTLALSGGSTAAACYRELSRRGRDWSSTTFLLSDERWVPVEHSDSNEGQARREWLDHADTGAIHSLRGAGERIDEAAEAYDRLVRALAPIDAVHLGLGDDGHTASLFPGSPALDVTDRHVFATSDDAHDWPRLTFTYPAIAACRTVIVTVAGAGKQRALARVRDGDPALPASRIHADEVIWLVDRAAAGGT